MDMMDLTDLAMRGYNELSAGQHQRVALARGIVQDTEIMILDEPTANLDVRHQMYVTQLLREFADKDGKLVLMICHDLNIAARYASKIIVMGSPERIHSIGEAEDVITSDTIREVYGIDCDVVTYEGRPMVMLKSEFPDE
ncbi:MAG: ABC transporter ATP-binding protein [archaeon]|nr:ABC transporter ATP-binding protein [archaeon]